MPVKIPDTLPARAILESENIFVMGEERAEHQDIRPLRVAILNLMPTKIATETQLAAPARQLAAAGGDRRCCTPTSHETQEHAPPSTCSSLLPDLRRGARRRSSTG